MQLIFVRVMTMTRLTWFALKCWNRMWCGLFNHIDCKGLLIRASYFTLFFAKVTNKKTKMITATPKTGKHDAVVVLLHGFGDSAAGWLTLSFTYFATMPNALIFVLPLLLSFLVNVSFETHQFRYEVAVAWQAKWQNVKFILPTAPVSPVMGAHSWFDFQGSSAKSTLITSRLAIDELIEAEIKSGISPGRVLVMGFSQGGFMAMLSGFSLFFLLFLPVFVGFVRLLVLPSLCTNRARVARHEGSSWRHCSAVHCHVCAIYSN